MDMEQKLLAVITESLPQAHVGVLKDYLNKAATNEKEVARLAEKLTLEQNRYTKLLEEVDGLRKQNDQLSKLNTELNSKKEEVEKLQRELDLEIAIEKRDSALEQKHNLMELCRVVFQNPTYTHTSRVQRDVEVRDPNNPYNQPRTKEHESVTTTDTTKMGKSPDNQQQF